MPDLAEAAIPASASPPAAAGKAVPTLCLNMIVKNEAKIIERCLRAVADHIVAWVICDTGSADDTPRIIRDFFARRGIPGELHHTGFENFEQARNEALDQARASALAFDYILFTDADMELVVRDAGFRRALTEPAYQVLQKSGVSYWNTRLVRRDVVSRYLGVTHEYLSVEGGSGARLTELEYRDHASGSNRVNKYERDIRLLREGLEQEPDNRRYWFYLAQSYRDAGQVEEAVGIYAKRAEMGGWEEEAWYARLSQARCLRKLGREEEFLKQSLAAYSMRPHRAEPLYDLAVYHRERGLNDAALLYAEAGLALPWPKQDLLFIQDMAYFFGLRQEFAIAALNSRDAGRKRRGRELCNRLALGRDVPPRIRHVARRNMLFYAEPAARLLPSFEARTLAVGVREGFRLSSPSVAQHEGRLWLLARELERGTASTPDAALRFTWSLLRLGEALQPDLTAPIQAPLDLSAAIAGSLARTEDSRLISWRGALWLSSGLREPGPDTEGEMVLGQIVPLGPGRCDLRAVRLLPMAGSGPLNWMPLASGDALRFVASADPTRILYQDGRRLTESVPGCAIENMRGSAQAVPFHGGWLGVLHEAVPREGGEQFIHRFVWLDRELHLRAVSRTFHLREGRREVVAGLAWHPDGKRLVLSFAGPDEAGLATVEADQVKATLFTIAFEPLDTRTRHPKAPPAQPSSAPQKAAA